MVEKVFDVIVVGPLQVNCYILGNGGAGEAMVIDPGGNADAIFRRLSKMKLNLAYIVNTHAHVDHVGGIRELKDMTGAEFIIHPEEEPDLLSAARRALAFGFSIDKPPKPDRFVEEGDTITLGEGLNIHVLHTPGHSPGGISLLVDDMVFVGDTLFAGSVGRWDLPGGSYELLIQSIKRKLLTLGDNVKVYPGHGPSTTVGDERNYNPFVR